MVTSSKDSTSEAAHKLSVDALYQAVDRELTRARGLIQR